MAGGAFVSANAKHPFSAEDAKSIQELLAPLPPFVEVIGDEVNCGDEWVVVLVVESVVSKVIGDSRVGGGIYARKIMMYCLTLLQYSCRSLPLSLFFFLSRSLFL